MNKILPEKAMNRGLIIRGSCIFAAKNTVRQKKSEDTSTVGGGTCFCSLEVEVPVVSRGAHWRQVLFGMFEVAAANNEGVKQGHGSCPNRTVDAN
jgi:hypothetical protein